MEGKTADGPGNQDDGIPDGGIGEGCFLGYILPGRGLSPGELPQGGIPGLGLGQGEVIPEKPVYFIPDSQ